MSVLFSVIFFVAFGVYLFFGIYIIRQNMKTAVNRVFLGICISLCFWSLGFSMANTASDLETCLFWRRISAIGWGSVYSFLVHYALLLVNKELKGRKIRFQWAVYIPAVISVYAFSLSSKITSIQFNLIYTNFGWVNIAVKNNWTLFFNIYYIAYVVTCLVLFYILRKKTSKTNVKKQANSILIATTISLFLGTLTDVILTAVLPNPLPQMAPIFILIPITTIYYNIRKYGFMEIKEDDGESILTYKTRRKLCFRLIVAYLGGGLLSLLSYFLFHMVSGRESLESNLFTGVIMFFLGILMLFFQLIKKEKIKISLMLTTILLSIPIIILRYSWYSGVTVWAIPIILMIASLTFDTLIPLILITIVSIITQVFVWGCSSESVIKIDEFDHIIRIGLYIIAFWLASFVNKTYTRRLRENIYQAKFQKLVSKISSNFISINPSNIDGKINDLLIDIGHFFEVDHTYIVLINRNETKGDSVSYRYKWQNDGECFKVKDSKGIPLNKIHWWAEQLYNKKMIFIADVDELPAEALIEKGMLLKEGIKSTIVISIEEKDELLGFMGLGAKSDVKKWTEYHSELLRILSNLLSDGLTKVNSEKKIEYMAYYDSLTDVPNRMLFSDKLSHAIYASRESKKLIGVILIDLDNFKIVNDIMGHNAGDTLLKTLAQNLGRVLKETDEIGRFGGDEFMILLNDLKEKEDVIKGTENIMGIFEKPFCVKEQEFFVTASAGVAIYPTDGNDAETLIKNADIAMYAAKAKGKNQFVLCTEDIKNKSKNEMELSHNLHKVEQRGELQIYYQPQIEITTGEIVGLEALLRWNHPRKGVISPNTFIPLAEKNGTINKIGNWALKTVINQNKEWQKRGFPRVRVAVNLSVIQFNNLFLADNINKMLKEADLDPKYLELEITESIATKEIRQIILTLNKLKEKGISISIDDFGKEYSSLNRLKLLPFDRIKVDMQFIQGIEKSEKDRAITSGLINLAKSLGMTVLAEGVETKTQLDFLNKNQCDEAQGYYYHKPMLASDIEELFHHSK